MEVGYAARRQVKAPLSTPRQLLGKKAYEKKGRHDFIKKVKKKKQKQKTGAEWGFNECLGG